MENVRRLKRLAFPQMAQNVVIYKDYLMYRNVNINLIILLFPLLSLATDSLDTINYQDSLTQNKYAEKLAVSLS